ncbi:MAG: hypothetical protein LBI80_00415 [Endomicrobium sp.]|nr:hypothetical protein [Endomicrobium sp.]
MEQNILKKIKETVKYITSLKNFNPKFAIIAGSGINNLEEKFTILKKILYSKIPHFLKVTVQGHKEVLENGKKASDKLSKIITEFVDKAINESLRYNI